jgi:hypothetical protein
MHGEKDTADIEAVVDVPQGKNSPERTGFHPTEE